MLVCATFVIRSTEIVATAGLHADEFVIGGSCNNDGMTAQQSSGSRFVGYMGAAWGAVGVTALLTFAIYRLAPKALAAYEGGLSTSQWVIAGMFCVFMAYSEGYRGFQDRFSPRTAARIRYLRDRPKLLHTILAPLFAMGYFHATRRTKVTAYVLLGGIVVLVSLVHLLEQPWRGIIDAGVVLGLAWGVATLTWSTVRAMTQPDFEVSPQVPDTATERVEECV